MKNKNSCWLIRTDRIFALFIPWHTMLLLLQASILHGYANKCHRWISIGQLKQDATTGLVMKNMLDVNLE